ncbi:MAG TPA: LppX_LprAFG lipoprotein [Acidimicrobiales bacterium]
MPRRPFQTVLPRTANKLVLSGGGLCLLALLAACGSSSSSASPQALLENAKSTLDSAQGVHFTLTSTNAAAGGTVIEGGQGDMVRPDRLQGSLDVSVAGGRASVKVVAVGNTVEAQLPFSTKYSKIDPASFGLGNPTDLLSTQHGLSSMLTSGTGARKIGTERVGGELLDEIRETIPGSAVPLLPNQDPSRPVVLVAAIDPSNHQLRRVDLTGPFVSETSNATFTVTLTNYGESVPITLPPTS